MKVFVAGEGPCEIGKWAEQVPHRATDGVLGALLRRLAPDVQVIGGTAWSKIRKARAGGHHGAETRNVLGAANMARERGADALVWVRDTDHKRDDAIAEAMAKLDAMQLIEKWAGGAAQPCLEAWILSLDGDRKAEERSVSALKQRAAERKCSTELQMIGVVDRADLRAADAKSLGAWLRRASALFSTP